MLNRAEFGTGQKVNYWDGKKFITASVTTLNLNPISNIIEYRLFYREGPSGKRNRMFVTARPTDIKESIHFKR